MEKPKIICIHLFNDYSGSPLVFSQAIKTLIDKGHEVDIYTSKSNTTGFLSNITKANYFFFSYKWSKHKIITLLRFIFSQLGLLLKLLKYKDEDVIFYINTILPFGAGLAGRIAGKRVIYHIHETSVKPKLLKQFLFAIANHAAQELIYVSYFIRDKEPQRAPNSYVVYNTLSKEFLEKAKRSTPPQKDSFMVLMLASLKEYKGVIEFIDLAMSMPDISFNLVLNASQEDVDNYFASTMLSENITLFPVQSDVHPFYRKANIVLNLSHPEKWVETFGMTALEAMSYGIPVIVPPVGGIAEIVNNDSDGFKIDVRHKDEIIKQINLLYDDDEKYNTMSSNARVSSTKYTPEHFSSELYKIFNNK